MRCGAGNRAIRTSYKKNQQVGPCVGPCVEETDLFLPAVWATFARLASARANLARRTSSHTALGASEASPKPPGDGNFLSQLTQHLSAL